MIPALLLPPHELGPGLHEVQGADEVHGDGPFDELVGDHADQRVAEHAGVGDEHVELTEAVEHGAGPGPDAVGVAHVEGEGQGGHVELDGQLLGLQLHRGEVVATVDDDGGALGRELTGDGPPDASGGTRDQGDAPVELSHGLPAPRLSRGHARGEQPGATYGPRPCPCLDGEGARPHPP